MNATAKVQQTPNLEMPAYSVSERLERALKDPEGFFGATLARQMPANAMLREIAAKWSPKGNNAAGWRDFTGKKARRVSLKGRTFPAIGGATRDSLIVSGLEGRTEDYFRTVPISLENPTWLVRLYRAWLSAENVTRTDFERFNAPPTLADAIPLLRDLARKQKPLPSKPSRSIPALNTAQIAAMIEAIGNGQAVKPSPVFALKDAKAIRKARREALTETGQYKPRVTLAPPASIGGRLAPGY